MTEPVVPAAAPKQSAWRRYVAPVVIVVSIAWTLALVRSAWGDFSRDLEHLPPAWLAAGLALSMIANLVSFAAFAQLFGEMSGRALGTGRVAHLYFVAQLMRHLPGRFFGFAYQIAATRETVPAMKWVGANAAFMAINLVAGFVIAAGFVVGHRAPLAGVLVALAGAALGLLIWTKALLSRIERFAAKRRFPLAAKIAQLASMLAGVTPRTRAIVVAEIAAGWLIYFAAWGFYIGAYPAMTFADGVRMCALYSLAWLAGYLSFVAPSGLGVRELVFAALASEFPAGATAYAIVVGRLSLLVIDVIMGLFFFVRHAHRPQPR
jgi:glycosyltransferase 2 family protein